MCGNDYFDTKHHQWLVLRDGETLLVSAEELESQWRFKCYDWEYYNWAPKASGDLVALPGEEGARELLSMCAGTRNFTAAPLDAAQGAYLLFYDMSPADACRAWSGLEVAVLGMGSFARRGGDAPGEDDESRARFH